MSVTLDILGYSCSPGRVWGENGEWKSAQALWILSTYHVLG